MIDPTILAHATHLYLTVDESCAICCMLWYWCHQLNLRTQKGSGHDGTSTWCFGKSYNHVDPDVKFWHN